MSSKTGQFACALAKASVDVPVDTVWQHYKGGVYQVIGHAIDTDTLDVRVLYRRIDGPEFNEKAEAGIAFARLIGEWVEPRFVLKSYRPEQRRCWALDWLRRK